jgi:hypothetical protein
MNSEIKRIGKKTFITSIKALSSHSPTVTEENQEKFKMADVPAPLKYKSVTAAPTSSLQYRISVPSEIFKRTVTPYYAFISITPCTKSIVNSICQ